MVYLLSQATRMAMNAELPKTTRILIVDDIASVRSDLCTLLELVDDLQVVGQASNGQEAIEKTSRLQPDVILMDLEMPLMNGYQSARLIKENLPACRVVALSIHNDLEARQQANQAGIDAFIVKGERLGKLIQAIRMEK